jgi:NAD(P)-dependent dehydrogenase (short-subunit alcohol dehydrogenase family)
MNIVITGANRGIGLELARQYLARGDTVHAGAGATQISGCHSRSTASASTLLM